MNRILVIGTPICPKCKQLAPKIEEYCKEHSIEYEYKHLGDAPFDLIDLIKKNKIATAPVVFVYKGEEVEILVGDKINSFLKNFLH